jgi:hypothetical protein
MRSSTGYRRSLPSAPLRDQLARTNQAVQRAIGRAETLSPADVETLLNDIDGLLTNLTSLTAHLTKFDDQIR